MIPEYAQHIIETWRLGFVASADENGKVNVSPKGTFIVADDKTIAYAEMRSPNTLRNIAVRPEVEVNFVDILSRKGVRMRGNARAKAKGSAEFARLLPQFQIHWSELEAMINAAVIINVTACKHLMTPLYELGAKKATLRQVWKSKIQDMPA